MIIFFQFILISFNFICFAMQAFSISSTNTISEEPKDVTGIFV